MRGVVQRVLEASVILIERVGTDTQEVHKTEVAKIGPGFLILIGVHVSDTEEDASQLAEKVAHLRILEDEDGKLNLSLLDKRQEALVVSNFTLYGDARKGRRPSFIEAASGSHAESLYRVFGNRLSELGIAVQYGRFGCEMNVALVNDGPITLLLDSKKGF